MKIVALTNESSPKVDALIVVATRESLDSVIGHMQAGGEVFREARADWRGDVMEARYVVVCDSSKGGGVLYADCVNCAKQGIDMALRRLSRKRLPLVGYAVALPDCSDYTDLQAYFAQHAAFASDFREGHA